MDLSHVLQNGTIAEAGDVNQNFTDLKNAIDVLETADDANAKLTGNQTLADKKTFTTIPEIPTDTPTADAQVASKSYVDDQIADIESYSPTEVISSTVSVTLPNGLIMKWGETSSTGDQTITFPVSFPGGCLNVILVGMDSDHSGTTNNTLKSKSAASFDCYISTAGTGLSWQAIGY